MNELPPELRSLIDQARDGHDPDDNAKQRVRAALTLSIAAATVATTATAKGLSPVVLSLLLAGGSIAAVGGATIALRWESRPASQSTSPAQSTSPTPTTRSPAHGDDTQSLRGSTPSLATPNENATPATEAPEPPAHHPRATPSQRPRAVVHEAQAQPATVSTPTPTSTLADELSLVTNAAKAIGEQRWSDAIRSLDQHAERFPTGALTEERNGLRALSLCKLQRPDGKVAAERFVRAYPTSPLIERLRASCADLP